MFSVSLEVAPGLKLWVGEVHFVHCAYLRSTFRVVMSVTISAYI